MEDSPKTKRTLSQVLAGQWQIPLFILSLVIFVVTLLQLRPKEVEPGFEDKLQAMEQLARENRYFEFYARAEDLRLSAKTETELGQVHGLVARSRVQELSQRHQLDLEADSPRSDPHNYENIINDYREALSRGWVDTESSEASPVFGDLSLAFWCLGDSVKAIDCLKRAISLSEQFNPTLHRRLVSMYLASRPRDYLDVVGPHLELILAGEASSPDDKAWAFVRKAEWLISRGEEAESLKLLGQADQSIKESCYGEEVEYLYGRALRYAGRLDEADLMLRELIERMGDRGDIYGQVALELGKINYEQYRDHDARGFYEKVISSQAGKDGYAAGKLGLAECTALQQRYDESLSFYQEVVELLEHRPNNSLVSRSVVQSSLATLTGKLELLRQYEQALPFMELEQKITLDDDVNAEYSFARFARLYSRIANQLRENLEQSRAEMVDGELSETHKLWVTQQEKTITSNFEKAAEQYLRVAKLAVHDDSFYGSSLRESARCYDEAGNAEQSIVVWRRFVDERESDPYWPVALYSLAQSYQSLGDYEQAIHFYTMLRDRHPNSPAAFDAVVPLARCFLIKEPAEREKAENLLLGVRSDPALTPQAPYYRQATLALGELYYDNENYSKAITVLTEAIDRYPGNKELGKSMFIVADSYRNSGLALDETLASLAADPTATVTYEKTSNLRRELLSRANEYFEKAVQFYEEIPENTKTSHDKLYLRHCWLYRADCLFDLGLYRQAVDKYEDVALRYQLTPTALIALMQIINSHIKLGNIDEARAASRRAMWQLTKMSDEELTDSPICLTREQWKQWLEWLGGSGLWSNLEGNKT